MSKTALMMDPVFKNHWTGDGHPERPARYDAVARSLETAGLIKTTVPVPSREATEEELTLCHPKQYVALVRHDVQAGYGVLSTGDTQISEHSWKVALRATGGVLNVVDAVVTGKARNGFCLLRPPGHHATPDRGMGFCLFNHVAIGARHAQRKHGMERVLIADWDVHHGNGTQDIFYQDGSVFFFSTHQSPWYPGTGARTETGTGAGKGTTLNCPFPAGSGREEILGAFRNQLLPAANSFRPDLVMISAGFDSRAGDPLGRFQLSDEDFAELTTLMMEMADKHAKGRVVAVLEGGYNLTGLASAAAAHVRTLAA
jgi:acetoin utilization deacetylase AcuC-like enzyme